jgi:hypothetical protein
MFRGRWLRYLLATALLLTSTVAAANPAAAAPCTGITCVHYYADITISASVFPWWPVAPGTLHSYTVQITNTGWRTGGLFQPMPAPGPDSGEVAVVFHEAPWEIPIADTSDYGVPFHCARPSTFLACVAESLPTNTTSQFTITWRTPTTPDTYTMLITVDSYKWTEYDENNNSASLTYVVA